jgi:hypothetical protein
MAKAEAPKASNHPPKKSGGKLRTFTIIIIVMCAAPFMMPTVTLILAALIPTYIAFATDSDPQKSGAVSVGAMNIAGTVPFVIDLWSKGQTMPNAYAILTNANDWLVILGASFVGQLIVYTIPQAIATLTLTHAESRAKALRKNLETLKESWGLDVATTKPIDKIGQN